MKTIKFLLITILFISYGCSEEQSYETESKTVSIWMGESEHINIETNLAHYNYTLELENQNIATAIIDDNIKGITIITHNKGKTKIWLLDTDNNKRLCEITIYSNYFSSPEIIDCGFPVDEVSDIPGVIIKASNAEVQKIIKSELLKECKTLIGTTFSFNMNTLRFTMKTYAGNFAEGTYEWTLNSLTLKYNNKVDIFDFKFAEKGARKYGHYIIQADKTEKYQLQYPAAGIKEVKVCHYWQDNGIIQIGGITF